MTDTTTESVTELAHRAFADATKLTAGEIVRFAAFIVDHHAHAAFDKPTVQASTDKPQPLPMIEHPTELQRRLQGARSGEAIQLTAEELSAVIHQNADVHHAVAEPQPTDHTA